MSLRRTLSIISAAALFGALPAAAQQGSSDQTLQRIWRLGMDSSHVQSLAHTLFDSIGPRLTGSPGIREASDWVISMYKSWGIDARREQYGTWRGWRRGVSHIDLVAPRVRSLEGTMLSWSPGTKGKPVTAQAIVLPKFRDSTEFVKWLPQARGKIVLLSPAWPTCRPSEDWMRWSTPASMAHMDTLIAQMQGDWAVMTDAEGKPDSSKALSRHGLQPGARHRHARHAAREGRRRGHDLVASQAEWLRQSVRAGRRWWPWRRAVAWPRWTGAAGERARRGRRNAAAVAAARTLLRARAAGARSRSSRPTTRPRPRSRSAARTTGLSIRLADDNEKPMVRLDLDAQLLGEQPAFNTIGVIKGSEKPDEYVMLSAHFDSWDGSSGATDNGTGTLMAMEAMRILKTVYPHPKRTIMVGHWASEEQGLNGSTAFTEMHPEVMKGLQALFNQDNGTGRVQSLSASGLTDIGRHLKSWYAQLPSFFTDSMSPNVGVVELQRCADRQPRRNGRRGVRLLRHAVVRHGRGELELQLVHVAHQPRHVRQDRVRRSQAQRDAGGDAGVPGVGGSGVHLADEVAGYVAGELAGELWQGAEGDAAAVLSRSVHRGR